MKFAVSFPEDEKTTRIAYCVEDSNDTDTFIFSGTVATKEQNTDTTIKDFVPLFNQEVTPEISTTF